VRRRAFTALGLSGLALPSFAQGAFVGATSERFIEDLWQLDPDAAVAAGRFEFAGKVTLPSAAQRQRRRAFLNKWRALFDCAPGMQLPASERMDCAILAARIKSDLWRLDTLREWAWNPSEHNPAGNIDLVLNTDWAPLQERVKVLHARIKQLPAFYAEARKSLAGVTREHTELALQQAPGVLAVLDDVESHAQQVGLGALMEPALRTARQA
jgi:hypothetical protein